MKRKVIVAMMTVFATISLTGCCLKHEWKDATCTEPMTCAKCGEVQGEPLGHEWAEATCEQPKTCSVCGETEGEALGHEWVEANFNAPKTCSVCGATEGEAIFCAEYDLGKLIGDAPLYYVSEKGVVTCALEGNVYKWVTKTYDDTPVYQGEFDMTGADAWSVSLEDGKLAFISSLGISKGNKIIWKVNAYDFEGKQLAENVEVVSEGYDYIQYGKIENDVYSVFLNENGKIQGYLDMRGEPKFLRVDEYEEPKPLEYDKEKWGYMEEEPAINGYFVSSVDNSEWGFTDKDGNIIKMYKDATNFNASGYALMSEDGKTYKVIDKDFNVIEGKEIPGDRASQFEDGSNLFYVINGNDMGKIIEIKQ